MNASLLSSKKMDYCTPQDFFDKLNQEFHFTLDAAATSKSAKCPQYYTPETDGIKSSWSIAGGGAGRRSRSRGGKIEDRPDEGIGPYQSLFL